MKASDQNRDHFIAPSLQLLLLGLISGLISGLGIIPPWKPIELAGEPQLAFYRWGPGMIYGLLVMVPLTRLRAQTFGRGMQAVILSIVAYFVAFGIQKLDRSGSYGYLIATGSAGLIGSTIISCALMPLSGRRAMKAAIATILSGTIAGVIFGLLMLRLPSMDLWLRISLGFMVWQTSTAAALSLSVDSNVSTRCLGGGEPTSLFYK